MIERDFRRRKSLTLYYALYACEYTNRKDRRYILAFATVFAGGLLGESRSFGTESESLAATSSRLPSNVRQEGER